MKPVFLDTVGLLAIWDADDQWHQPAVVAYGRLTAEKAVLVTTSYVIAECGNAAARRPYRQAVADFRRALEVRNQLIFPNSSDWLEACVRYEREREGAAGLVESAIICRDASPRA